MSIIARKPADEAAPSGTADAPALPDTAPLLYCPDHEYSTAAVFADRVLNKSGAQCGPSDANAGAAMSRARTQGKAQLMLRMTHGCRDREPSANELAAIDAEWPLIAAELDVVDAEVALVRAPGDLTARRLAKAKRQLRALLVARRDAGVRGFGGAA